MEYSTYEGHPVMFLVEDNIMALPFAREGAARSFILADLKDKQERGAKISDMTSGADGSLSAIVEPANGKMYLEMCRCIRMDE